MKRIFTILIVYLLASSIGLAQLSKEGEIAQRRTIDEITRQIRMNFIQGLYDKVIEDCEKLDALEPGNPVARYYQEMAIEKKKSAELSKDFGIGTVVTPAATPEPTITIPPPQPSPLAAVPAPAQPGPLKSTILQHLPFIVIPIAVMLIGFLGFILTRKKRKLATQAKVAQKEIAVRPKEVLEQIHLASSEPRGLKKAEPELTAAKQADLVPSVIEPREEREEPAAGLISLRDEEAERKEEPKVHAKEPEPYKEPEKPLAGDEEITPIIAGTEEEEGSLTAGSQLDELLSEEEPKPAPKEPTKDYEKIMLDPTSGDETLVSPSVAMEETIVEKGPPVTREKKEVSRPAFDEEDTRVLSTEKGAAEPWQKKPAKKPQEEAAITSEITEADREEEIFETDRLGPLGVEEGETLLREEGKKRPEPEKRPTTEPVAGDVLAERHERLFEDQYNKGCQALDKGDWAKAVHYLTIASALRPKSQEVKEKLKLARDKKREEEKGT